MFLAIDIGGTKTLIAILDDNGVIQERIKFHTPPEYPEFLKELADNVAKLSTRDFVICAVGVPGKLDRNLGIALAFGNLNWQHVPIRNDIQKIVNVPVLIENDANLAGLSESMLLKNYKKVLYVTISTGIGTGIIADQKIDPEMADSEGGNMLLEHDGKIEPWEDFASGRAIVKQFGKEAREITDTTTWQAIAHNITLGLIDLIALVQPNVIVLGGGVGTHYSHYQKFLTEYLKEYETPLLTIPPIQEAARPEEAVIYGCYDLATEAHGKTT